MADSPIILHIQHIAMHNAMLQCEMARLSVRPLRRSARCRREVDSC